MAKTAVAKRPIFLSRKNDVSFTDFDVIRIACLNLSREELRKVILFFMIGVPLILAVEQLDFLLTSVKLPKTLILLLERVLKHFIGDTIMDIVWIIGFRFNIKQIRVLHRIVKRLQDMFPR